jgi:hypothetical protein
MRLVLRAFLASGLLAGSQFGVCQEAPKLAVGERVAIKVPLSLFRSQSGTKVTKWSWNTPYEAFAATIDTDGDQLLVNNDPNWQVAGFPWLAQVTVEKIKPEKAQTLVELKGENNRVIILRFNTDPRTAFPRLVVRPGEVAAYRHEAYAAIAAHTFSGSLSAVPDESRLKVLELASGMHGTIASATYKESLYLLIDLGKDSSVYNELRMNQAQRVARVMNDTMLVAMKAFGMAVADVPSIYGLKLQFGIPHRQFTQVTGGQEDTLEVYAPSDLIKKFKDTDITSQQLVDGSVVILNGNRIQVSLSQ